MRNLSSEPGRIEMGEKLDGAQKVEEEGEGTVSKRSSHVFLGRLKSA